jgi:tetratricopeptide (TPR) repeat protein
MEGETQSISKWKIFGNVLLTLLGFLVLMVIAAGIMYFATSKLKLQNSNVPSSYWLVPIFGCLGGVVGAIITKENQLFFCRFRDDHTIDLGIVGSAATGLGGAAAVMFIFGISQFDITQGGGSADRLVQLVSITFIAGAFGPAVVQIIGKEFLRRLEKVARAEAAGAVKREVQAATQENKTEIKEAKSEVKEAKQLLAPRLYVQVAVSANNDDRPAEALENTELALKEDPKYYRAYVEKGRALKRLGRIKEALEAVEESLKIQPAQNAAAFYNRACYKVLLGQEDPGVFDDLKKAFTARPKLREQSKTDPDLSKIIGSQEMQDLLNSA